MLNQSHSPGRRMIWRRAAFASVLLAGTAVGGFAIGHAAETGGAPVNPPGAASTPQTLPDFTHLVAQAEPAVVSITNKLSNRGSENGQAQGEGPQLPFPFNQMVPREPEAQAAEARGSGFIIDANGTIVTNNHVVNHARSLTVTLNDGTTLPAKVIGRDPRTDIAVLKVDAGHALPFIQLGNSADVKPGEWVVAVGNPFGLGGTVTAGIVSAVSRDIGSGPYDQFIQIDAPINPGNSGGPLFTQDGRVVGMNSAIISPSGGSVGIGFAIPSNTIHAIADQLAASGHVTRGYIGVEAQQLQGATARALHVADNSGALVAGVVGDGPAGQAGIAPGDVIEAVNGQKIAGPRDLAVDVAGIRPGDEARLAVLHDGQNKDISLRVAQLPGNETASNGADTGAHQAALGLALAPLTPDLRSQLDVPEGTDGALVREVQPGSPADHAGLQAGDVIVGVGAHAVASPSQAAQAIRLAMQSPDHAVALRVIRDGQPAYVGVQLAG
jgi:serine protease Do